MQNSPSAGSSSTNSTPKQLDTSDQPEHSPDLRNDGGGGQHTMIVTPTAPYHTLHSHAGQILHTVGPNIPPHRTASSSSLKGTEMAKQTTQHSSRMDASSARPLAMSSSAPTAAAVVAATSSDDGGAGGAKKRAQSCDICRIRKVKCVRPDDPALAATTDKCKQCLANDVDCTYAYVPKKPGPQTSSAKVLARREEKDRQHRATVAAAAALGAPGQSSGKVRRRGTGASWNGGDRSSSSSRKSSLLGHGSPAKVQSGVWEHAGGSYFPSYSSQQHDYLPASSSSTAVHDTMGASFWAPHADTAGGQRVPFFGSTSFAEPLTMEAHQPAMGYPYTSIGPLIAGYEASSPSIMTTTGQHLHQHHFHHHPYPYSGDGSGAGGHPDYGTLLFGYGRKSHPGSPMALPLDFHSAAGAQPVITPAGAASDAGAAPPRAACLHSSSAQPTTMVDAGQQHAMPPRHPPSLTTSRGSSPRPGGHGISSASASANASPIVPYRTDLSRGIAHGEPGHDAGLLHASHFHGSVDAASIPSWSLRPSATHQVERAGMPSGLTPSNVPYFDQQHAQWSQQQQHHPHPGHFHPSSSSATSANTTTPSQMQDRWSDLWQFPAHE